jgi:Flp pilus assembly protein TadG
VGRLLRDCVGSSLVEFTIVFPVYILVAFGTVDAVYMLSDWALANKAAYAGAHTAIISNPVAAGITDLNTAYEQTQISENCFSAGVTCPTVSANCTWNSTTSNIACTCVGTNNGCLNFTGTDNSAFTTILNRMQAIFPRLQRQNVAISYVSDSMNLGFAGQPNGIPMAVTVGVSGMTHHMYFLGGIMNFFGGGFAADPPIPTFATTLSSEDMTTN